MQPDDVERILLQQEELRNLQKAFEENLAASREPTRRDLSENGAYAGLVAWTSVGEDRCGDTDGSNHPCWTWVIVEHYYGQNPNSHVETLQFLADDGCVYLIDDWFVVMQKMV